tara:strand:- start:19 stop:231 length:213 start_codon:yes stop_codon:yes gene_type:complete
MYRYNSIFETKREVVVVVFGAFVSFSLHHRHDVSDDLPAVSTTLKPRDETVYSRLKIASLVSMKLRARRL